MTRKYLWVALAAVMGSVSVGLPSDASAQVAPNIRYVDYNPDAIIRLTGHTGYQMMLEFGPGEKVETVGIGDSSGWQVTPNGAGTIMFLKPVGLPATTNLSIITNQRRYNLELIAKSGLRVPQTQITYAVRFRYPQDATAADTNVTPPPLIATPPELWNRAYSYDGARANVPEQVFDDGKATYFRFAAGSSAPAIFSITSDAGESIVNFAVRGPYTVVEQIAPQFVLRHGKEVTIIFNDAYAVPTPGADAPRQRATKKEMWLIRLQIGGGEAMSVLKSSSADPRSNMDAESLEDANQQILSPVAMPAGLSPGMKLGVVGISLLGILTFTTLATSRTDANPSAATAAATAVPTTIPQGGFVPQAILRPGPPELPPPTLVPPPVDSFGAPALGVIGPRTVGPNRFQSPGVVVDMTKGSAGSLPPTAGLAGTKGEELSAEDRFADRIAAGENAPARAERIVNSGYTVPQGAIIAGVLETAINSDLPGFVRAVVSRDVMGFDGRRVLIPSGSRLIGQYRSGLAAGQSRAFIVWSRLTRPDGVTVSLGSPVTDPLGRAGLGGKVDSHFLKRFGSAILLSVVQSGLGLVQRGGNDVVVRTADDAKSVAGIALQRDINIPPTVKVAQGTAIRIFIARDLDFSGTDGNVQ